MKKWLFIWLIGLGAFPVHGQQTADEREKLLEAAREIMQEAGICTLITLDENGQPRARPMDAFSPDEHFVVWMATNPNSRKVKQLQQQPLVSLYYFHQPSGSYVLLSGKAELVTNTEAKQKYWKPQWQDFYPDYPNNYLLIEVTPIWLEVLSESRQIVGDSVTWQPPRVEF